MFGFEEGDRVVVVKDDATGFLGRTWVVTETYAAIGGPAVTVDFNHGRLSLRGDKWTFSPEELRKAGEPRVIDETQIWGIVFAMVPVAVLLALGVVAFVMAVRV